MSYRTARRARLFGTASAVGFALAALRLAACAEGEGTGGFVASTDATARDARADTSNGDAGEILADSAVDATADAATDSAIVDATTDAALDAGPVDAGPRDGGPVDAAPVDAGPVDAGPRFGAPPTCDGTLALGEYPATYATAEGQSVGVAWDDTNLYLAVANANLSEGFVFFLGDATPGSATGQSYDNLTPALPFAARLAIYAKANYQEVRAFGAGAWTQTAGLTCFQTSGGAAPTREMIVPWAQIGGRPASFNMLNYMVYPNGNSFGAYGVSPTASLLGSTFSKYFSVASSAPGNGPSAFAVVKP
jgi:hypothetical protein